MIDNPVRYVTISRAAELTGVTEWAIRKRITRCVWLEGVHWMRRGGRIYIDLEGIDKWVEMA